MRKLSIITKALIETLGEPLLSKWILNLRLHCISLPMLMFCQQVFPLFI